MNFFPIRAGGAERDMAAGAAIAVLAVFFAATASAQQRAPQAAPQPAGGELGRLFFTPQQRQELDRRRQLNIQEVVTATSTDLITANGQIARSSGKSTTWINGVPQDDTHKGRDPTAVTLGGGETESSITIKIGQTIDKTRGAITDGLAGGEIKTRPGSPPQPESRERR